MAMAAVYHAPPCVSCASPAARDAFSTPVISPHRDLVHLPLSFPSCSNRCGARLSLPPLSSFLDGSDRRWRRHRTEAFSNAPEAITASSWNDSVMKSDVPVIVEFWASWCGPCRMVGRVIDEIAREYAGRVKCFKLDTDEYPQFATSHSIERIPTVLLYKNGEKLESLTGTLPKSVYVAAIERLLSS